MENRAQSLRENLPPDSTVQVTTGTEVHTGKVVKITDDYLILTDALILISEVKTVKIISPQAQNNTISQTSTKKKQARTNHSATPANSGINVDQLFSKAQDALRQTNDFSNAISMTKQVLKIAPDYPGAREFLEQCHKIAQSKEVAGKAAQEGSLPQPRTGQSAVATGETRFLPGRSKYFALALQATSDDEAIEYLYRSIEHKEPKSSSAVKDLANRLAAKDRGQEAIDVLKQYHPATAKDQQSIDNLLINIYIKLKRYEEALILLEKKNATTSSARQSLETLKKIADCYMKLKRYDRAIPYLEDIRTAIAENKDIISDSKPTLKRLALCYMQGQQYNNAEQILRELLEIAPDDEQALELRKAMQEARETGRVDEHLANKLFSDTSNEPGAFARFFLERCEFRGVPSIRLQEKKFDPSDIDRLEDLARGAVHAGNYNDGAEFYLSAANIVFIEEWAEKGDVHKYLYRSFTSRGDASLNKKSLDTVREWYCEALHNYDKMDRKNGDEKDVIRSIVKFLYSVLGEDAIPLQRTNLSLDHVLGDISAQCQEPKDLFAAVAYLTSRSKRARQLILPCIFAQPELRMMAFNYLADTPGLAIKPQEYSDARLTELWSALDKKNRTDLEGVYDDMRLIAEFELKQSWAEKIESNSKRINDAKERLFLQLDRDRLTELSTILDLALRFFRETSFEQKEYFCERIGENCRKLLESIKDRPTRLSIECLYHTVETIQKKVKETLDQIYVSSEPQIALSLAQPYWVPDVHKKIVVQINATNSPYCSPAESVVLTISDAPDHLFVVERREVQLEPDPSLQGGEEGKFFVHIRVTEEAIRQEAFSLPVSVQYHTRLGAKAACDKLFHIQLREEQFVKIDPNPYAPHIRGTPVRDRKMFYGRDEFITKVARTIAHAESKAIVIYGQKRAGKSSILYHLKLDLQKEPHLLVADVGSMATVSSDVNTSSLSQILWKILSAIKKAILEKNMGNQEILQRVSFPEYSSDFFNHPVPLIYFQEILDAFHDAAKHRPAWENMRIVLLIDEFQYIYELIKKGRLEESFMKHWKALLEKNLFNAILVGQNVMKKFKGEFANEFDAMQEEPVSYLEDKDARRLIVEPIHSGDENGEGRYRQAAIQRILSLTAGSPYYIQIFCYYLVEHMNREQIKLVTEAIVDEVKLNLLKGRNAIFRSEDDFDNLIKSGDPSEDAAYWADAVRIMACIAKKAPSPCPRKDIDKDIDRATGPERVDTILDDYVRRGVIHRDRDIYGQQNYALYVGLFQEWLNLHK